MNFDSLQLLGAPFELAETYVEYDGPRTFALRSLHLPGLYYIVNTVEVNDERGHVTMLAAVASVERFNAMRSGLVSFREVYTEAHANELFRIDWLWDDVLDDWGHSVTGIMPGSLGDDWLPREHVRLNVRTDTVERFRPADLVARASAELRTVFAVKVEHEGARITEFPARNAGQLQLAVDSAVTALSREYFGKKKSGKTRELHASVLELRAASFVVVMGVESGGLLVEPTGAAEAVFDELTAFVGAVESQDAEQIMRTLKRHHSATRNALQRVLKPLAAVGSGLSISAALTGTEEIKAASAGPTSVKAAADLIDEAEPLISEVIVNRGALTGLFVRTRRFEVFDSATAATYKGRMSEGAAERANGLPVGDNSYVRATIRVETPFANDPDETEGVKYILEHIEPFEER